MCPFEVGQRVVCLADFGPQWTLVEWPRKDVIYTIRSIRASSLGIGLLFVEITNPIQTFRSDPPGEPTFAWEYFRPLQEKSTETGMAILRKILKGAPITEDCH